MLSIKPRPRVLLLVSTAIVLSAASIITRLGRTPWDLLDAAALLGDLSFAIPAPHSYNESTLHEGENGSYMRSASNAKACNDTALYYNVNGKSWGVLSKLKPVPSVESALQTTDAVWLIVNWISLPKARTAGRSQCSHITDAIRGIEAWEPRASNMTRKLLITDSADTGSNFQYQGFPSNKCLKIAADMLGAENVHLATRRLIIGRDLGCYNVDRGKDRCKPQTPIAEVNGTLLDYRNSTVASYIRNGTIAKWDFAVRGDYLPVFDRIVRKALGLSENETVGEGHYDALPRTLDVAHFWDKETSDGMSAFRNEVSATLEMAMHTHNWTGTAGLVSERGKAGRTTASESYAGAMLNHKIIIAAQRDRWEDHLRLFESLSSGAMVLADPITHPPAGLVDGENIVYFTSLEEMVQKIEYYLRDENKEERARIARKGRRLAMEHHLGNHRLERLILGDGWPTSWTDPVAPLLVCE